MNRFYIVSAAALLLGACNQTTASISVDRADASVRRFCPAFRVGVYTNDASRTYGTEQITTYRNESRFNCRCVVKTVNDKPACAQVKRFTLGDLG
ncbi:MAG: hypothetical protein ACRCV9_13075 [Burkholderiaceae bacterium]